MKLSVAVWLCLVLLPAQALAQGAVTGVVTDASGAVLPGVTVEMPTTAADRPRRAVTDGTGRYEFRDLPIGIHSLTFTLPGFESLTREGVAVTSGAQATVDAVLRVAALQAPRQFQAPLPPSSIPPGQQQAQDRCLHGDDETPAEFRRRSDAFAAMHMIDRALTMVSGPGRSPSWEQLAASGVVAALRGMPGPAGDLARRFGWGESEPLPGWTIVYLRLQGVRFALRDVQDPCGFTYTSDDPNVLPRGFRILPLTED